MRITALFLICLAATSFAASTDMKSKLASLLTVKAQASDAVDSALQLLYDLVQAEHDEQADHDVRHAEEIRVGDAQIAYLSDVKAQIRQECDNGHEHLQFILDEIHDTETHLAWIQGRVDTLNTQRQELADARCESNAIFVQTLREHNDAFEVIAWLRQDLANWQAAEDLNSHASLAQITNIADKLKAYSHLFDQSAIKEFAQLADPKAWEELTDGATRREIDAAHQDNNRDALSLENFDSDTTERDVHASLTDRLHALLDQLEAHLQQSLRDLEANEIRAAYDLGEWLDHADQELVELAADAERKHRYLEKLALDREVAQDFVDRCEVRYEESCAALQAAIDDLNAKKAWYAAETKRRSEEIDLLHECIAIFEDKVASMKEYLRGRIEDYQGDQTFDQTTLRGVEF
jgi:chromosome segregation ATPase